MVPTKPLRYTFICGCDRGGTTALAHLLNNHPEVVIGIERFKFRIARNPQKFIPSMFEYDEFFALSSSDTNINNTKWDKYYTSMRDKYRHAKIIGDKVPRYFQHFERIERVFPDCLFIFLVRDPVDVASSWQVRATNPADSTWPPSNDYRRAVAIWNASLQCALAQRCRRADSIYVIEYGEFFTDGGRALRHLLATLRLEDSIDVDEYYRRSAGIVMKPKMSRLSPLQVAHVKENAQLDLRTQLLAHSAKARQFFELPSRR